MNVGGIAALAVGASQSVFYSGGNQVTITGGSISAQNAVFGGGSLVPGTNLTCPGGSNQNLGNITCNSVTVTSPGFISASNFSFAITTL